MGSLASFWFIEFNPQIIPAIASVPLVEKDLFAKEESHAVE